MSLVKSLWASIQGDPVFMRRVNGWLTVFWIVMIPFSVTFGLLSSVVYVSALSLWALVSGHWSAWQAARVEVEQMAEAEELERRPVERRVVQELIDKTDVMPAAGSSPQSSASRTAPDSDNLAGDGDNQDTVAALITRLATIAERLERIEARQFATPTSAGSD